MGWDGGHERHGSLSESRVLRWSLKLYPGVGTGRTQLPHTPIPSFSRASPKATSATMAQSLAPASSTVGLGASRG